MNLFCPQNNVIVTKKHKRHFEVRILSLPLIVFHRPVDDISGGPTSPAQFIDTHIHVTSRNQHRGKTHCT